MTLDRSIVINGDLGSGKSTVSIQLAERLGLRRISIGDLYREMARERNMTALQLNLHAELDDAVDSHVDELQERIAASGEHLVVDSRLAWHFFTDAFKIHLVTSPKVAAQRAVGRPSNEVESYSSVDEAVERLRGRSESERMRFLSRYGVDKARLRNYDVICDTTSAGPDEVTESILAVLRQAMSSPAGDAVDTVLLLDPGRVYPTEDIRQLRGLWDSSFVEDFAGQGVADRKPISVGYTGSTFFVLDGHRRLSAALQNHLPLVIGRLSAERQEMCVGGLTAIEYFEKSTNMSMIYDWEAAHDIELPLPHHLLPVHH
jgi:cytidylate kinase